MSHPSGDGSPPDIAEAFPNLGIKECGVRLVSPRFGSEGGGYGLTDHHGIDARKHSGAEGPGVLLRIELVVSRA